MSFYQFEGLQSVSDYINFIQVHWIASFKDGLMVVILYLAVGILMRNLSWGRKLNNKRLIILVVLGMVWAVGIEYHAVNVADRWAYAGSMPTLPVLNVGVLPILQMMILPAVAIWLARSQLRL